MNCEHRSGHKVFGLVPREALLCVLPLKRALLSSFIPNALEATVYSFSGKNVKKQTKIVLLWCWLLFKICLQNVFGRRSYAFRLTKNTVNGKK